MAESFEYQVVRRNKFINKIPKFRAKVRKLLEEDLFDFVTIEVKRRTREWEGEVYLDNKVTETRDKIQIDISVENSHESLKYIYQDRGTEPHEITGSPYLVFPWGGVGSYKANNKPVDQYGPRGQSSSSTIWRMFSVQHPGNKAAKYTETFMKPYHSKFLDMLVDAYNEVMK